MPPPELHCPRCRTGLPPNLVVSAGTMPCTHCSLPLRVMAFPALIRGSQSGRSGEKIRETGQASCYYHPQKQAVVPCDHCGRFLCALCDIEFHDQHLCPQCLESGKNKGRLSRLENHRVLYDNAALYLAVLPLIIMWPLTIVTAPMAIFVAIWYWKAPGSIIPRSKIRYVVAILLGLIQIGGWGALIVMWVSA